MRLKPSSNENRFVWGAAVHLMSRILIWGHEHFQFLEPLGFSHMCDSASAAWELQHVDKVSYMTFQHHMSKDSWLDIAYCQHVFMSEVPINHFKSFRCHRIWSSCAESDAVREAWSPSIRLWPWPDLHRHSLASGAALGFWWLCAAASPWSFGSLRMSDLPVTQFTVALQFSTAPEQHEWTTSHLLDIFRLNDTACEINDYLMPMATPLVRHLCPAVEVMNQFWAPMGRTLTGNNVITLLCLTLGSTAEWWIAAMRATSAIAYA